jgi:hypothetical protein
VKEYGFHLIPILADWSIVYVKTASKGDRDDVRAYRYKAERAAALIYPISGMSLGFRSKQNEESDADVFRKKARNACGCVFEWNGHFKR